MVFVYYITHVLASSVRFFGILGRKFVRRFHLTVQGELSLFFKTTGVVSCGRLIYRCNTICCWQNEAFSTTRSVRLRVRSERMSVINAGVAGFVQCLMRSCSQSRIFAHSAAPGKL
jgi:hypothetical protein